MDEQSELDQNTGDNKGSRHVLDPLSIAAAHWNRRWDVTCLNCDSRNETMSQVAKTLLLPAVENGGYYNVAISGYGQQAANLGHRPEVGS
jgi:hypothetical protein